MGKKHDEESDLKLLSRFAKVNYSNKTINCPKTAILGIHQLGRIDFLVHYCGWTLIWNNSIIINREIDDNKPTKKDKKEKYKLTNKNKRNDKK